MAGGEWDSVLGTFSQFNHGLAEVIASTPRGSMVAGSISDRWLAPWQPCGSGAVSVAGDAMHPMTPNLGQGGCCALEDAVVLGRHLGRAEGGDSSEVAEALRAYEKERLGRCFPLTVRANVMGSLLQIDNPLVCSVRDQVIQRLFNPASFLDHTQYDCRVVTDT